MNELYEGLGKWVVNFALFMLGLSIDSAMGNFQSGFPLFTLLAVLIAGYNLYKHHKLKGTLWWLFLLVGLKLLSSL